MKKIIRLLTLILVINISFQTHVQAQNPKEWKALGSNTTGHIYYYVPTIINGDLDERKISIKLNRIVETKDGFKSLLLEYSIFCQDKAKLIRTIKNYSELDLIGNENITPLDPIGKEKRLQKPNTLGMQYVDAACENKGTQNSQPPSAVIINENIKSYKFINKLSPEEVYNSVILKGMSPADIDIFLIMYAFIWEMNNFLNDTPNNSARWMWGAKEQQQRLSQHKNNVQLTLNIFEETISTLAKNIGLTNIQFKQSIGIVEVFTPPACDRCDPGYKTLKVHKGGLITEILNRNDIASNGIHAGLRAFSTYRKAPGSESVKNNKGHPGDELTPSAFLDFYSKWIPVYFLEKSRISKLVIAASNTEERLEKQKFDADQASFKRQEDERKQQDFLKSPEGKKQIAKEQAEERLRQKQFEKDFPFYAVVTCGNNFPIFACFSGSVTTELELTNGAEYKMYTVQDLMFMAGSQRGLVLDLRNKFSFKMQNSTDSLILNLKVYDRKSNRLIFEKSAARFGVIRFSN